MEKHVQKYLRDSDLEDNILQSKPVQNAPLKLIGSQLQLHISEIHRDITYKSERQIFILQAFLTSYKTVAKIQLRRLKLHPIT
jgi:hypothetical protein